MAEHEETEWQHKDKMWTYLLFLFLLVGIIVAVNVVWKNPAGAEAGLKSFLGLPSWLLAAILFAAGLLIFWLGLKMEPDWPEAIGAAMMAGAVAWFELIAGWKKFDFGGLIVIPYLIPVFVFVLLLVYAVRNSR
ncbi:MAG TPA: hypothetical protein VLX92_06570 [Kofleriaceae bacterium]|nr:hypothetical protein [Kofleriaceae bacterium]